MKQDLQVFDLIKKEYERQSSGLELIASENYVSDQVMEAMGSIAPISTRKATPASVTTAAAR